MAIFFTPHSQTCLPGPPESIVAEGGKVINPAQTQNRSTATPAAPEPTRGDIEHEMLVTAYCSCPKCCGKPPSHPGYGITASGVKVNNLTAAADWKILPRGTEIYVEGVGRRVVQDKGGAVQGNRLDLRFPTHQQALEFGIRTLTVKIIE